jgi:ABC-2 type transport system permease protein
MSYGRQALSQIYFEQLGFWLNPVAAAFAVGFPLVFLVFLGVAEGDTPIAFLGNMHEISYYAPSFVAFGVMTACFTLLAISLVNRRETGMLKRLRLSPLPSSMFLVAVLSSTLIVSAVQTMLVIVTARVAFGVSPPDHVLAFLGVLLVGATSFTAMGVAFSSVIPNVEAAPGVTNLLFFVLAFVSGVWFPITNASLLGRVGSVFPVRRFVQATFATFNGSSHGGVATNLLVVAAWGGAGLAVALRRFSWAPRSG